MVTTPAILDQPRSISYRPTNSVGPFSIPFPVFDLTGADLRVTLGRQTLQPDIDFTVAASEGVPSFYGVPNTWTTAAVTLRSPATGLLTIAGRRRPRRQSQVLEGRGIPARDYNFDQNVLTATLRETWDRAAEIEARALILPLGDGSGELPAAIDRAGKALVFDLEGNPGVSDISPGTPAIGTVSNDKLAKAPGLSVKGNPAGALAQPQDISLSTLAGIGNPLGDAIGQKLATYASKGALAAASQASGLQSLYLSSFDGAVTNAASFARWKRLAAAPSPVQAWHTRSLDGAWWELDELTVTPQMFGARGNNVADDAAAFNLAIVYAQTKRAALYIPAAAYALGAKLLSTFPINISCDPAAQLRWPNPTDCGWVFDMRPASFGLYEVRLPGLYSPAINSIFQIPGYGQGGAFTYDPSARAGTAIRIIAASRMSFYANYIVGFEKAYSVEASYDTTYGAHSVDNIDLDVNTIDFTTYAFYFDAGPAQAKGIHAIRANANTVWAKFPFYFAAETNNISQGTFTIGGQTFVNEVGGAGIFALGGGLTASEIDINWLYAGKGGDSPPGTPDGLTVPYIAGSGASNGQTTDGNASLGYFTGYRNEISVGIAVDQAGQPGSGIPAAGNAIRVRDVGSYNKVSVRYWEQADATPITLSQTRGEANYNGGVGAASLARKLFVRVDVPTLAAGSAAAFYFYNQLFSAAARRPVSIIPIDTSLTDSKLSFAAADRVAAGSANREGAVYVSNPTAAAVSAATYYFFLELGN